MSFGSSITLRFSFVAPKTKGIGDEGGKEASHSSSISMQANTLCYGFEFFPGATAKVELKFNLALFIRYSNWA
jgi:hypothetical protein